MNTLRPATLQGRAQSVQNLSRPGRRWSGQGARWRGLDSNVFARRGRSGECSVFVTSAATANRTCPTAWVGACPTPLGSRRCSWFDRERRVPRPAPLEMMRTEVTQEQCPSGNANAWTATSGADRSPLPGWGPIRSGCTTANGWITSRTRSPALGFGGGWSRTWPEGASTRRCRGHGRRIRRSPELCRDMGGRLGESTEDGPP